MCLRQRSRGVDTILRWWVASGNSVGGQFFFRGDEAGRLLVAMEALIWLAAFPGGGAG